MLKRIVYMSTASHNMFDDDLDSILETARRNNARDGLSGLLLFHNGTFLQCLEGPTQPLMRTLTKIRLDNRHRGFRPLIDQQVSDRLFGSWEMGYEPKLHGERLDGFAELQDKVETGTGCSEIDSHIEKYFAQFTALAA